MSTTLDAGPWPSNDALSGLARRVRNFLWGRPSLRRVTVDEEGDSIVLRGTVKCFYDKQLCIHGSQRVAGVRRLVDEIVVEWPMPVSS